MKIYYAVLCIMLSVCACNIDKKSHNESSRIITTNNAPSITKTAIVVLGTTQDAGSPQIACKKQCCASLFDNTNNKRHVVSLGLIDAQNHKTYLFEATPDIGTQIKHLTKLETRSTNELVDGIFLTHAHIGHYTGLMFLGKEATNANKLPVYAMPKMKAFLENNGPWSQLVKNQNISLNILKDETSVELSNTITVTPFLVPHRDEFSETVGYKIKGKHKTALFIPDIDKWEKWNKSIIEVIKTVDYAFLDATFYSGEEINNRDISEIPHPFIIESLNTFNALSKEERGKIIFIHFNHTNPVLNPSSKQSKYLLNEGFKIARKHDVYSL